MESAVIESEANGESHGIVSGQEGSQDTEAASSIPPKIKRSFEEAEGADEEYEDPPNPEGEVRVRKAGSRRY